MARKKPYNLGRRISIAHNRGMWLGRGKYSRRNEVWIAQGRDASLESFSLTPVFVHLEGGGLVKG
jgi:hypothetical protein